MVATTTHVNLVRLNLHLLGHLCCHVRVRPLVIYTHTTIADGLGETSPVPRPLRDDEVAQWILLDGVGIVASLRWSLAPH